jgi:hypothetical protein
MYEKQLATPEARVKFLEQIIADAKTLPPDKQLNKIVEFCSALSKAFTTPSPPQKGTFIPLTMQAPPQKENPIKAAGEAIETDSIKAALAAVTKGTPTDKETIVADNLK